MQFNYSVDEYRAGGTYIGAFTRDGEPYADVSVNLLDYGFLPLPDEIYIPAYKLPKDLVDQFVEDLAKEVLGEITFGPFDTKVVHIRLKDGLLAPCEYAKDGGCEISESTDSCGGSFEEVCECCYR